MSDAYAFDFETARRLAESLRREEARPRNARQPRPALGTHRSPVVQVVRVTSTTPVSIDGRSYLPGKIEQYSHATGAWADLGDCYVLDANA